MGAAAAGLGWFPGSGAVILLLAGAAVAPIALRRSPNVVIFSAAVLACAGGISLWHAQHGGLPGDAFSRYAAAHPEAHLTVEGTVVDADLLVPPRSGRQSHYTQFTAHVDSVARHGAAIPISGRVRVRWNDAAKPILPGSRVRVFGEPDIAIGPVNPGVHSVEAYYRNRGIHTVVRVWGRHAIEVLEDPPRTSLRYWLARWRQYQARVLRDAMPPDAVPFALAVWLGDRSRLTEAARNDFVVTGTAHLLSVSGLHMAIVFASANFGLRLLIRKRKVRTALIMAIVWAFAITAGARIGSVRAALMICLYLAADLLDREPDAPTALAIAAMAFTFENTNNLFDAGFLLSFSSVASLILFREPISELFHELAYYGRRRWRIVYSRITAQGIEPAYYAEREREPVAGILRDACAAPFAVQVLPLPIAIHFFHVIPLLSPLVNVIVIPLLTVALWLCFLAMAAALAVPPAALWFGYALDPVVFLIESITSSVGAWQGSHLFVTSPAAVAVAAYWATAALLIAPLPRMVRKYRAGGILAGVILTLFFWNPLTPEPRMVFLDVGHGDSTFIQAADGSTALIDGGDSTQYVEAGRRVVAPFLWANHVTRLDVVVATHADRDHMGGLLYVLDHFDVGEVILNPYPSHREIELALIEKCQGKGVPVRRVGKGEVIAIGALALEVLHPPLENYAHASANDQSLVFAVDWYRQRILLPADVEEEAEADLMEQNLGVTVLKVPHHGSDTSSTLEFVERTQPKAAVISVGRRRGGKVLDDAVVDRYHAIGAAVFRTDYVGAVTLRRKGETLQLIGERPRRGYVYRESTR